MEAQTPREARDRLPGRGEPARTILMRARQDAARRAYARPLTPAAEAPRVVRRPRLRLVGDPMVPDQAAAPAPPAPIEDPADPRWVLALRTAEQLQGTMLPPDRRDSLLRMARMFGLTAFDANLIIAIVQDQARRGVLPGECPARGEPQLRMIPLPAMPPWWSSLTTPRMQVILLATGLLTAEVLLLWWLF